MPFPTNLYPRAFWTGSLSVEAALPVAAAPPAFTIHKMENWSVGGVRETIVLRTEESRNIALQAVEPMETQQWQTLFYDHAARGRQFEFLLDRFTGPVLTFVNTIKDQDLAGVASFSQTPSYQTVGRQVGHTNPGSHRVFVRTNVGSENHTLTHSQGTFVFTAAVSFTPDVSLRQIMWVGSGNALGVPNALGLRVQSGVVALDYYTSAGSLWTRAASMTWPNGAVVTFVAQWQSTRSLNLHVTVQGSATVTATLDLVGSSGIPGSLSTLANTITIFDRGTLGATFTCVAFLGAFYRYAYDDPSLLASHFPLGRNYYSLCEVLNMTAFAPTRANVTTDLWDITFAIRQAPQ